MENIEVFQELTYEKLSEMMKAKCETCSSTLVFTDNRRYIGIPMKKFLKSKGFNIVEYSSCTIIEW